MLVWISLSDLEYSPVFQKTIDYNTTKKKTVDLSTATGIRLVNG